MTPRIALLAAIFASLSSDLYAEVRFVRAGEDLQAALNAARPGDELRLAPETMFSGNFVLPVTTGTSTITIRTDLPDSALPGPNQRVTPATAVRFARIQSPNSAPALRTAPGAHHWRLMFLELRGNKDGFSEIIQLGDGSDQQNDLAQVPYQLELDRVYIHGDRVQGQKRGIALNARSVTIRNCYISDIKAVGQDTQAIAGWNGPGPYTIDNNYLEAAGEVFLLGGADPAIRNLVASNVEITYNHMTRPMSWRDPIVAPPASVSAVGTSGGSLPAGVYAYRVTARQPAGGGSVATSLPSTEVSAVASSGAITVNWTPVADATEYNVYARNPAGATQFWTVTAPSFVHNGATGGRSGLPPTKATVWQVKNILELKAARHVRIQHNVFENNWGQAQSGYAILFTPRNQDGTCTACIIEDVTFSDNLVFNVAAAFSITGYDDNNPSGQTNNIRIRNNYFDDVRTELAGSGWGFIIGESARDITIDQNTLDFNGTTVLYAYGSTTSAPRAINGFRYTNNDSPHGEYGINGADASTGTLTIQMYFPGSVITGNWLSGGVSSKYPPGNRFNVPFQITVPTGTQAFQGSGANLRFLQVMAENVRRGLKIDFSPQTPGRIIR